MKFLPLTRAALCAASFLLPGCMGPAFAPGGMDGPPPGNEPYAPTSYGQSGYGQSPSYRQTTAASAYGPKYQLRAWGVSPTGQNEPPVHNVNKPPPTGSDGTGAWSARTGEFHESGLCYSPGLGWNPYNGGEGENEEAGRRNMLMIQKNYRKDQAEPEPAPRGYYDY